MRILTGWRARMLRNLMVLNVVGIALRRHANPVQSLRLVRRFARLVAAMGGERPTCRVLTAGRRCFTHLHAPAWPSATFTRHIEAELEAVDRASALGSQMRPGARLQSVIFAVTKSCNLRCRHCCEWQQLNRQEKLSATDLITIVRRLQAQGVTQVHFSGGEPLHRLDDILATMGETGGATDFWLFTSGWGLDQIVARRLKAAGLRGVNISLDHWRPASHDAFRGREGTFEQARRAAAAVGEAGLALCVTLCPSREFVTWDNLTRYAGMAHDLGAGFVQILEPRNVGRFVDQDVALAPAHQAMLDRFFTAMNFDPTQAHLPPLIYPAHDQRRLGCVGAGHRYLYVDTDGLIHPCPFCRGAVGNMLDDNFAEHLDELRRRGCSATSHHEAAAAQGSLIQLASEAGGVR